VEATFYPNDLKLNVIGGRHTRRARRPLGWFKKPMKRVADFKG